jgi:hypothetical protein
MPVVIPHFCLGTDGHMDSLNKAKSLVSTSIKINDQDILIEKLQLETGDEKIRLSSSIWKKAVSPPLILSELELLDLLNKAIHAGVLPRNFIGKLRERIEI